MGITAFSKVGAYQGVTSYAQACNNNRPVVVVPGFLFRVKTKEFYLVVAGRWWKNCKIEFFIMESKEI